MEKINKAEGLEMDIFMILEGIRVHNKANFSIK